MDRQVLSVAELTHYIQGKLETDPQLQGIWVQGEIWNFTHHSSGHMYFTLKDDAARLRCVMFRGQNARLRFKPVDGTVVMAHGSITVYPRNGDYQFYIDAMEPAGLGALFLAFEQLKEKLSKEGLFDPARKRIIPKMPAAIALITSPTGAAVHDMIKVLQRRRRDLDILVIPAQVQGTEAPASICRALGCLNRIDGLDLAIVGRGGGSIEELWAFNDEMVARSIAAAPIPIISAVGHQTDFTIADLAADLRAPTPSAAAEMATADASLFCQAFTAYSQRMASALSRRVGNTRQVLRRLSEAPVFSRPGRYIMAHRQAVDSLASRLERGVRVKLDENRAGFRHVLGRLESLSPLATLQRGYSICLDADQAVIRSADQVAAGSQVQVLLRHGRLHCRVEETEGER